MLSLECVPKRVTTLPVYTESDHLPEVFDERAYPLSLTSALGDAGLPATAADANIHVDSGILEYWYTPPRKSD